MVGSVLITPIILQVYAHSLHSNSEEVMQDFDTLIDNIKTRLRSNHNFGDETGTLVWQGAEPTSLWGVTVNPQLTKKALLTSLLR
jgi:hypothetical protein